MCDGKAIASKTIRVNIPEFLDVLRNLQLPKKKSKYFLEKMYSISRKVLSL